MKTFLIFGSKSRLAQAFTTMYPEETIAVPRTECDITNKDQIKYTIEKYNCPYIINCAALTDIELCEKDPKLCFDTNTLALYSMQDYCSLYHKKLIHISSNYALYPKNIYGLSKYISEKLVDKKHLIIRTSFYDEKTFIIKHLLNHESVTAYTNMYLNPISINRVAKEIYLQKDTSGIRNIFSLKKISWYEFAEKVCDLFKLDTKQSIKKTLFKNKSNTALRPLNAYIKPDIQVTIEEDLKDFKNLNYLVLSQQ